MGRKKNSNKIKPEERYTVLKQQVNAVKELFNYYNVDVPFFIAGGSIFSILNCYDVSTLDIDIYFHSKDDFNRVQEQIPEIDLEKFHKTDNAWTVTILPEKLAAKLGESTVQIISECDVFDANISSISSHSHFTKVQEHEDKIHKYKTVVRPFQLIIKNFGSPFEIFKTYDFNCSCCAYTSNYELITSDDFSRYIKYNPENMHGDMLKRYLKYTEDKGAEDTDNKTIKKLLDFYIKNKDVELQTGYSGNRKIKLLKQIQSFLYTQYKPELTNYVHDKIVELYDSEQREKIFEYLFASFRTLTTKTCDEYVYHQLMFIQENGDRYRQDIKYRVNKPFFESEHFYTPNSETIGRVKYKYAEYFI